MRKERMDRREFLQKTALTLSAGTIVARAASEERKKAPDRPRKSVMYTMLPGNLDPEARFHLAKEVGFEGVEIPPVGSEAEASALRHAAEKAGIPIQSVIYGGWDHPLSDPNPNVV